ncbi:MAG: ribosome recycling factor [Firmicutes bacterium]|nr:ribosome recycling factor [Bacillota bacterium]
MTEEVLKDAEERMKHSLDAFRRELAGVRAGRATPALLEKVRVDYYGTPTPIQQLATIHIPEPRLIVIQPWDKSQIGAIERAIQKSDLGLQPTSDGQVIRLALPQLTEQRRQELVKLVRNLAESARVAVRNIRRESNDTLKELAKEGEISEDEARAAQDRVQKLTDRFIAQIAEFLEAKEKEIMEV